MRCDQELSVGAYVLDALEPDEQLRMARHVQECPACAETVRELEGLPRLMALVPTPGEEPVVPVPSELAYERFRREATEPAPRQRRRRGKRWWAAVAAAALLVAGAVTAGAVALLTPDPMIAEATQNGVHLTASYRPADNGGTSVTIELEGVQVGQWCELLAVDEAGNHVAADEPWEVTYRGPYHWSGWIDMPAEDVAWFLVRERDGSQVIAAPATQPA
ncbi:anti-sigma factor family protein [Geodermatophilus sp. URMC 64]